MFSILVIAAIVGLGSCALSINNCPFGLVRDQYLQPFGKSCFRFVLDNKKDFDEAAEECGKVNGGTLALVKTKEINDFIVKQLKSTYQVKARVWIGLSDRNLENTFVWEDGTVLNMTSDYTNFARFEGPRDSIIQGSIEDCVAIDTDEDSLWHDFHCESRFFKLYNAEKQFVCQYDMINLPPPTSTTTCKPITNCDLDCGLDGLGVEGGCPVCKCAE